MPLGLFNWTSDLSYEPEYPPLFDKLWAESSPVESWAFHSVRGRCLVDVVFSSDRSVEHKKIGMIEYIGRENFDTLKKSFGKEEWYELANALGSRGSKLYDMILTTPVFVMFQSPEDFPKSLLDSDYEWSDDKDTFTSNDFYYWPSYDWWICINRKWNAKLVEMLERKNPDVMEDFAKCRKEKELSGMKVAEIKEILRNANQSTSGKKTDLIQRIIDHNLI
mgnify:FL=1